MMLAKSLQSAAGNAAAEANYIEDVFSTWLYTSSGTASQNATISNGIDLSTEGSLIWTKSRSNAIDNYLVHRESSSSSPTQLISNSTAAAANDNPYFTYLSTGYRLPTFADSAVGTASGNSGYTYASWTFRKQPKFFDVMTYTGDGTYGRALSHSLGSVPGCIIVKRTSGTSNWGVFHQSLGSSVALQLNTTAASAAFGYFSGDPTTSDFFVTNTMNASGSTYVAYLFAHDAGGFGESGEANAISCGSVSYNSSATSTINLGYEPQWVMLKNTSATSNWYIVDTMRGFTVNDGVGATLNPNLSNAEYPGTSVALTNTGFTIPAGYETTGTWIYVAIRRGPMKVPESGTSVFSPNAVNAATGSTVTTNFPVDLNMVSRRTTSGGTPGFNVADRLRGLSSTDIVSFAYLLTYATSAEGSTYGQIRNADNTGFKVTGDFANEPVIYYSFKRAPGFMDVCCYTGTGSARTVNHNLGVAPELMFIKTRSVGVTQWYVYSANTWGTSIGGTVGFDGLRLNSNGPAIQNNAALNSTQPTASVFSVSDFAVTNASGATFVNYLFASCPGVSKIGLYTGTDSTQQINCGFASGARFVMIKRADADGEWYVWDSARGIVAGNDPYLALNRTNAEVTDTDWVDTSAAGFELSNAVGNLANITGATYIFLAIA